MKKKKITKSKGILFWLTGLSGSGKSSIAKKIKSKISKKYGPTIIFNGDDLRNILKLKRYSLSSRLENGYKFSELFKFILNQKINIIFAGVGLFHKLRNYNKKNIHNYVEIYIKCDLNKILLVGKKKIYKKKLSNIVGKDLHAEFPRKPDIIVDNNFKEGINKLVDQLFKDIKKLI